MGCHSGQWLVSGAEKIKQGCVRTGRRKKCMLLYRGISAKCSARRPTGPGKYNRLTMKCVCVCIRVIVNDGDMRCTLVLACNVYL